MRNTLSNVDEVSKYLTLTGAVSSSLAQTTTIDLDVGHASTVAIQNVFSVATQAAKAFASATDVNIDSNAITVASHGYANGLKAALTTAGTLPTGLSATDYYVIVVDANTIKLATTMANAIAKVDVNITGVGVGTHTLTPAAIAGCTLKLRESNDQTNWEDVASLTASITVTGTNIWKIVDPAARYLQLHFTCTAGQVLLASTVCVKS